jgi:hypothetical protein
VYQVKKGSKKVLERHEGLETEVIGRGREVTQGIEADLAIILC